jgi:hypothetical protein
MKRKKDIIELKRPNTNSLIIVSFFAKIFSFLIVIFHRRKLKIPKGKEMNKLI